VWNAIGTVRADGGVVEVGTVTFGVHSTHEDHSFTYAAKGSEEPATQCGASAGTITMGKGTLQGATGPLHSASCTDPDDNTRWRGWLSGYIIVPNN